MLIFVRIRSTKLAIAARPKCNCNGWRMYRTYLQFEGTGIEGEQQRWREKGVWTWWRLNWWEDEWRRYRWKAFCLSLFACIGYKLAFLFTPLVHAIYGSLSKTTWQKTVEDPKMWSKLYNVVEFAVPNSVYVTIQITRFEKNKPCKQLNARIFFEALTYVCILGFFFLVFLLILSR